VTRIAVVDIGTNSTRLMIGDVEARRMTSQLIRLSTVTRLGAGVDSNGRLNPEAMERTYATLDGYTEEIERHHADRKVAVLTSAVRDAANGHEFAQTVAERYGLEPHVLTGDDEARLTYLGATSERDPGDRAPSEATTSDRDPDARATSERDSTNRATSERDPHGATPRLIDRNNGTPTLVIDIGGGSTELVIGAARRITFHVSTQAGVVRQTERYLDTDPPTGQEQDELAKDVAHILEDGVPEPMRRAVQHAIAVAGTATSLGAIAQDLEPYDPDKVHGYVLSRDECARILTRLAALPVAERREVRGLHPDRAPTIVAGVIILLEVLKLFGLDRVEVSENDILRGAALEFATDPRDPVA
jgi:exopolyphosphatase / guanosine-5'-triphosphate,3'-diphosphate pyrophosphatase